MTEVSEAGAFWDKEIVEQTHGTSWMEHPLVRAEIDKLFGGIARGEWFLQSLNGRTFERGLSIGCGDGHLERVAMGVGLCKRIDAFDGSVHSLRIARREAEKAGFTHLHYFAADFNRPVLPGDSYDIVFFNQSLHHVGELETLFRVLLDAMTSDAIMYLDEYIGPSRTQWSDELILPHREEYAAIPAELRKGDFLPLPIQADDPSEAIRSGEIVEKLKIGFDIEELRGYGGNLLAVIYPQVDWSRVSNDLVAHLIRKDLEWASRSPYYALIVAKPKRGVRKMIAKLAY